MENNYFETTNRKLENFLYMHGIFAEKMSKSEDGLTVWGYRRTDYFEEIFNEFKAVTARMNMMRR